MKVSNKFLLAASLGLGAFFTARFIRRRKPYNFEGKVVLITGGSQGLGLSMASKLAAEGARIAICARDVDEVFRAQAQLENISPEIFGVPADVTDRTQANRLIKSVRERFGEIDVLINNAGIIQIGPYNTMTIEDYEDAMATHFWAPLYTIMAVVPKMRELGRGRIVNISSIGGKVSVPHLLPYSASKFALTGLSEGLRTELKKEGIVVTTVCPGLMRPNNANIETHGQHEDEYKWFSVSGSLPFTSVDVESAAEKIINGCRYGDAEVILSIPAKVAAVLHGAFPGLTSALLSGINKILPDSGNGRASEKRKGYESESTLSESSITDPNEKATEDNNEI